MANKSAAGSNIRLQWTVFIMALVLLFGIAGFFAVQNKPREIRLGSYTSQQTAVQAALQAIGKGIVQYPKASSVTVHFKGPYPIPDNAEEFLSYNRRLGVLLAFVNRRSPGAKEWKFSKIVCPGVSDARLDELEKRAGAMLATPNSCGCRLEDMMKFG